MINDMCINYIIISAFALIFMSGCASQQTNTGPPVYSQSDLKQSAMSSATFVSDTVLMARVRSKFKSDDMVNDTGIHVTVCHGVVYLDGCVVDVYQHRMARDLVRSIDGVARVVSRLQIANPGTVFINPDIR